MHHKAGDDNAKKLAEAIVKESTIFKDRGVKQTNLNVLTSFTGTAVLVEVGFISNSGDLNKMQNQSTEIGSQIATGIINYLTNK